MTFENAIVTLETAKTAVRGKVTEAQVQWHFPDLRFSSVNDPNRVWSLFHSVSGEAVLRGLSLGEEELETFYGMDSFTPLNLSVGRDGRVLFFTEGARLSKRNVETRAPERVFAVTEDPDEPKSQRKVLIPIVRLDIMEVA